MCKWTFLLVKSAWRSVPPEARTDSSSGNSGKAPVEACSACHKLGRAFAKAGNTFGKLGKTFA